VSQRHLLPAAEYFPRADSVESECIAKIFLINTRARNPRPGKYFRERNADSALPGAAVMPRDVGVRSRNV